MPSHKAVQAVHFLSAALLSICEAVYTGLGVWHLLQALGLEFIPLGWG